MNSSSHGHNGSSALTERDSYSTVVVKNVVVLILGLIINYINGALIKTIRKHQIFYVKPHYILFTHLVVNDMIQLTTTTTLFLFSYIFHKINASLCCVILIIAVFTTNNTPLNLAVMAVECYIAICLPLRHAELCTIKRTYILIGSVWAMSAVSTLPDLFILLATEPMQIFHSSIFCVKDKLFHHPIHLKKMDISFHIYMIAVWLTLFYTYFQIILAAKSADGEAKKARNTILLHGFQLMLCMLTYIAPVLKKALYYLFPKHFTHVLFVSYIIIQVLPRFVSPIVYGLRDKTLRRHLKKYLLLCQ